MRDIFQQDKRITKLRLLLLTPEARGQGLDKLLLTTCISFAHEVGNCEMVLWIPESRAAACRFYRAFGWQLNNSKPVHILGIDLVEQS